MSSRQPPAAMPIVWLLTDERMGDALWDALARLPRGGGVIFRHHATPSRERRRLYERVRRIARARRLVLVLAGDPRAAIGWHADGAHGRSPHRIPARRLLRTAPAHDPREIVAARRAGVDLVLLSPVFATRSHPGDATLGRVRFGLAAGSGRGPKIIALGGMNPLRFRALRALGAHGWAAIDAWTAS